MKKIIYLFVFLALASGVHADDKKKKKNESNNAPAAGGGGARGGGVPGVPHMGQQTNRPGTPGSRTRSPSSMSNHTATAPHGTSALSQGGGKSSSASRSSNPLLHKGGQAESSGHASTTAGGNQSGAAAEHSSNPLLRNKGQTANKSANPLTQKNSQAARNRGPNERSNPNGLRNRDALARGERGANDRAGNRNWHASHSNYQVRNYREVFHNYHPSRHDRFWYNGHYDRVVVVGGGYYYWDAGYWYPAWGYDPAFSFYVYDGPIYSYDNLPPDQVTMNVQTALQDQGYYTGDIDGQVGPKTRDAIGAYQTDHDLEITAAVDEPTVESLGLAQST